MSDSLLNLQGFSLLTKTPNWTGNITNKFLFSRRLSGFTATAVKVDEVAPETPVALECSFQCNDKSEEFYLLSFFVQQLARVGRFWIMDPSSSFKLQSNAVSGASGIYCHRNRFDLIYQGYERVYIEMSNGDILTRRISAVVDGANTTYLNFYNPIDRDITTGTCVKIGRLFLGRFDSDVARFKFYSNVVSEITLPFVELVKEYEISLVASASVSPSASRSPSASISPSASASRSPSASSSATPSSSPSASISPSPSRSQSSSPSPSASTSPSASASATVSTSPSASLSPSASASE